MMVVIIINIYNDQDDGNHDFDDYVYHNHDINDQDHDDSFYIGYV